MQVINDLLEYDMKIYQDTEIFNFSIDSVLLANFVSKNKIENILDIGTGNAPIPLILSTKTNAKIIGVEIQPKIYKLAKKSVEYNNKQDQIKIINEDIKEYSKKHEPNYFDVITANPPFFKNLRTNKQNLSKYKALARHEITITLNDICQIAKKLLKTSGSLYLVHRTDRLIEIIETLKQNNLEPKTIKLVYPKPNTNANMVLIEARKNAKASLTILPPLICHKENGEYTEDIKKYFRK